MAVAEEEWSTLEKSSSDADFWTPMREEACRLILSGQRLSKEEIARRVGISRRQLYNWRQHPEFAARVEARLTELRAAITAYFRD